jgi:DNA-binding beta-propeller fold protein YncE
MHRIQHGRAHKARRASLFTLLLLALWACGQSQTSPPEAESGEPTLPVIEAPPLQIAASDERVRAPMDATPSPDGERVYYIALSRTEAGDDVAGVFSVAKPGAAIETLALGGPLIAPVGISVSLDGKRLFIADSGHESESADAVGRVDGNGVGAIVALSSNGGEISIVEGTAGFVPRGVVVAEVEGEEHVYFTGLSVARGEHGLFRVAASGGNVETIASGAPFVDPAGVTVTPKGDAYVIDAFAGEGSAGVVRVRDGEAERIVRDIGVGFPAGIASTLDGSAVLVSGLDPQSRRDRVYVMNAESLELSMIVEPFDALTGSAGLHRAHEANVFAWADTEKDRKGAIYVLEL